MKSFLKISGFFIFYILLTVPVLAADYDMVINGNRVMDPETNYGAVANGAGSRLQAIE